MCREIEDILHYSLKVTTKKAHHQIADEKTTRQIKALNWADVQIYDVRAPSRATPPQWGPYNPICVCAREDTRHTSCRNHDMTPRRFVGPGFSGVLLPTGP